MEATISQSSFKSDSHFDNGCLLELGNSSACSYVRIAHEFGSARAKTIYTTTVNVDDENVDSLNVRLLNAKALVAYNQMNLAAFPADSEQAQELSQEPLFDEPEFEEAVIKSVKIPVTRMIRMGASGDFLHLTVGTGGAIQLRLTYKPDNAPERTISRPRFSPKTHASPAKLRSKSQKAVSTITCEEGRIGEPWQCAPPKVNRGFQGNSRFPAVSKVFPAEFPAEIPPEHTNIPRKPSPSPTRSFRSQRIRSQRGPRSQRGAAAKQVPFAVQSLPVPTEAVRNQNIKVIRVKCRVKAKTKDSKRVSFVAHTDTHIIN